MAKWEAVHLFNLFVAEVLLLFLLMEMIEGRRRNGQRKDKEKTKTIGKTEEKPRKVREGKGRGREEGKGLPRLNRTDSQPASRFDLGMVCSVQTLLPALPPTHTPTLPLSHLFQHCSYPASLLSSTHACPTFLHLTNYTYLHQCCSFSAMVPNTCVTSYDLHLSLRPSFAHLHSSHTSNISLTHSSLVSCNQFRFDCRKNT